MRCVAFFISMLLCIAARADDSTSVSADALFREGRRAADVGNFTAACPKFEDSYRLEPALGTLLSLADCEENEGHVARAWTLFKQLDSQLAQDDDRRPIVNAHIRALEARVPNKVAVVASNVVMEEPKPPAIVVVTTPPDRTVQRTAAFVLGGVGVASLVTGGVFGVVALSNLSSANSSCAGNVCSSQSAVNQFRTAQAFAVATDVCIGVGIVLIGTALITALTGKRHDVLLGGRF